MYNINEDLDYFTREEFACQYTGENEISDRLLLIPLCYHQWLSFRRPPH
jgi:hypothetical protein